MTGRVVRFDAAAHKVADVLLPWFVNGTLDAEELAFVQQHVGECTRCQREVAWLRDLRAACIAGESMPGASTVFRSLRRRLEAPAEGQERGTAPITPRADGGTWWRWAIAAQLVVIVAMGTLLLSGADVPAAYRTLSARSATALTTGSLVVIFDPTATGGEINRVLRGAGARIVDGPTPANAYVLEVPPGQSDRAAQALKADHIAVLVERLGPQGDR
jgi:anti-sigma factor RsiW